MKRTLLTIIATLFSLLTFAQLYTIDPSYGKTFKRVEILDNFKLPTGDTLISNTSKPGDGEIVIRVVDGDTTMYYKVGGRWYKSGGGAGGGVSTNIYTANGTIPANITRTVSIGGTTPGTASLNFNNLDASSNGTSVFQNNSLWRIRNDGVAGSATHRSEFYLDNGYIQGSISNLSGTPAIPSMRYFLSEVFGFGVQNNSLPSLQSPIFEAHPDRTVWLNGYGNTSGQLLSPDTDGKLTLTTWLDTKPDSTRLLSGNLFLKAITPGAKTDSVLVIDPISKKVKYSGYYYNKRGTDSLSMFRSYNTSKRIGFAGDSLISFGDSYTVGVGASFTNRAYDSIIATTMRVGLNNQAISGIGSARVQRLSYTALPTTGNTAPINILVGLNDLWQNSGGFPTIAKIFNVNRAFYANNFLATAVAANDASVGTAGTWANQRTDTLGGKATSLSGFGRATSTVSSGLTWSFTGRSLVIGAIGVDGINKFSLPYSIDIDGIGYGIFTPNGQTDGVPEGGGSPNSRAIGTVVAFTNLSNGPHTVNIVAQAGTGTLVIDYFGTLKAPESCPPIYVGEIARMSQSAYNYLFTTYGKTINDSIIDLANYWIRRGISEWQGYPVTLAQTSAFFDPINNIITPNDIHPNDAGHQNLARAFMNVMYKDPVSTMPTLQQVTTAGATTTVSTVFNSQLSVNNGTGVGTIQQRWGQNGATRSEIVNAGAATDRPTFRMYNSSNAELLRFDAVATSFILGGNFGMGTTTATNPTNFRVLHMHDSAISSSPGFHISNDGTGGGIGDGTVLFVGNSTGAGVGSFNIYNQENAPIALYTSSTERARVLGNGNVLIGTTTDGGQKLQVSGNVNVSGTTTTDGITSTSSSILNGGVYLKRRTTVGSTTATSQDYAIYCNNTANITISLPSAITSTGIIYVIKKISNNAFTVSIDPDASENIEGNNTPLVVSTYLGSITLQSDGTQWWVN